MALTGVWGRKIGMTQVFAQNKSVPVTVVATDHWVVTNIRTRERDGYSGIQVGCLRKRYRKETFSPEWLKKMKNYFFVVHEIKTDEDPAAGSIGTVCTADVFATGDMADVSGVSRGLGFIGVYKRYGFGGAAKTHGSKMGKKPGSLGFTRRSGEVSKGKKLPGHGGTLAKTVKNLSVVNVDANAHIILVKGSIPGKAGSVVFVRKVKG